MPQIEKIIQHHEPRKELVKYLSQELISTYSRGHSTQKACQEIPFDDNIFRKIALVGNYGSANHKIMF